MQERPAIIIFSTSYLPFASGAELAVKEITDRLPEYDWHLVTARFDVGLPREERIGAVLVHRVGVGSTYDKVFLPFFGTIETLRLIRKFKPVAFWCIMATFASGCAYIANILRTPRFRIPVILTLQEGDSEEHIEKSRGGLIAASWRAALKRSDFVTVISTYLGERAWHYGYAGPVALIPNGVDAEKFSDQAWKEKAAHLAQRLGKKPGDVFLVTTSRLVEKNALGDVIRALSMLPEEVHFVIAGSGELLDRLQNLARDLGLGERVHFEGFVQYEDVPAYLHASDIFIRPSLSEGMGNSFIEAMAAGLPVIATRVGGIPDFLFDPRTPEGASNPTGLFCEVNNPKSVADQVLYLLEHRDVQETLVKNALALVKERYNWNKIAKDFEYYLEIRQVDTIL